ncbi:MAG: NADH-quinone oxidoreductase subunit J [Gammaproteobacteria bacterium]|nr:NADH-quinone oxidoreductase subunit J [Gammaproteobacteria bacterium]
MKELIVLTFAVPLLMAFLLPTISRVSFTLSKLIAPLVLLALAIMVVCIWNFHTETFVLHIGNFIGPQGIVFYVDRLALLFAFAIFAMTLLMWPWYFEKDESSDTRTRKLSLTLLLVAASAGMSLSGDIFNLYVFYELLAVASYGLIAAGNKKPAGNSYAAAFRYLMISALGSVFALLGIALIYFQTGTLNLAHLSEMKELLNNPAGLIAFVFILLGFGVKAELFPVNSWVPEAYMASSKRVAGLLAGLVSKLAVLVIIKALVLIYPQDEARQLLLFLGIAGVIVGEFSAMKAQDMTRMLSWSSIAQLGLVFIAFSIPGKAGMLAGLAVALHHLISKPAMFLIAERWGGSLQNLKGRAQSSPIMAALLILFALSMVGIPPLPGFWVKFLLLSGLSAQQAWLAIAVVLIMTVVETNYLYRVISSLYSRDEQQSVTSRHRTADTFSALILAGVLIFVSVQVQTVGQALDEIAQDAVDVKSYIDLSLGGGS